MYTRYFLELEDSRKLIVDQQNVESDSSSFVAKPDETVSVAWAKTSIQYLHD